MARKQDQEQIVWNQAPFKTSMDTHWMRLGHVKQATEPRFKICCLKSNTKCIFTDLKTNTEFEYNGAFAEAGRIASAILEKESNG